jgi:hypothetical protein
MADIMARDLHSFFNNRIDPQLERAVEESLKLLVTESIEILPEPEAPVRYRRAPVK